MPGRFVAGRGAFDSVSLTYTVSALGGYALALPAFAASEILIRGFYAMQRTWTPVLVGLFRVTLNLGLGFTLLRAGNDVGALAFAFSVAIALSVASQGLVPALDAAHPLRVDARPACAGGLAGAGGKHWGGGLRGA